MCFKSNVLFVGLALMPSILSGCGGGGGNSSGTTPTVITPPVTTPPVVTPGAYAITAIKAPDAGTFNPTKINDSGAISGNSAFTGGGSNAFLYRNGQYSQISYSNGNPVSDIKSGEAKDTNSTNEVVGYLYDSRQKQSAPYAFVYSNGQLTLLPTVAGSVGSPATALGINQAGEVVGSESNGVNEYAVAWQKDASGAYKPSRLPSLSSYTYSEAYSINQAGQIAGLSAYQYRANAQASLWQNGTVVGLGYLPGGTSSAANAINTSGVIAGVSDTPGSSQHAVTWTNGLIKDLGVLSGDLHTIAYGINDLGIVVGVSDKGDGSQSRAFIFRGGAMIDLNTQIASDSGWILYSASSINNNGQIVGVGNKGGFILTPK